jgi:hypothetical protein
MSWCAAKSRCDRIASIASIAGILLFAAGSTNAANGGTQTTESAGAAISGQESAGNAAAVSDAAASSSAATPAPRAGSRVRAGGSVQHRVDVLAKALQLDARQRALLSTVLEDQRQAVSKIWSDPALLPAERAPATRALEERTADQIRRILSEEQKMLYNPPKPQGTGAPPDVEGWMQKQAHARQQQ